MSHLRPMIYLACSRLKNSGAVVQYKEMPKNSREAGERQDSRAQVERSLPFFPPPPPPFPYRASYFRFAHFKYVPAILAESLAQAMLSCI